MATLAYSTTTNAQVVYNPAPQIAVIPPQPQQPHPATFHKSTFMGLGIAQVVVGVLCLIFGIVIAAYLSIVYIGTGIWGGLWYITTGSLGISVSTNPSSCNVVATLILSIISALVAFACLIWDSVIAAAAGYGRVSVISGLLGTTAFLHIVAFFLAICHSVFSGRVCGPSLNNPDQVVGTTTVVTVPTVQQGYVGPPQYYPQPAGTVYTNIAAQQPQPQLQQPPPHVSGVSVPQKY